MHLVDLPPQIRSFVAINLPDGVRAGLAALSGARKTSDNAIRWTPPEQIHLTLKFFGDVESGSLGDLEAALCRACAGAKPFTLEAVGAGAFPNLRRPRVLWAGLQGDLQPLSALFERVQHETEAWGRREERGFSPHLTLGRVKEGRTPDLRDWAVKQAQTRFGSWQVRKIHLIRSVLSPGGAQYSELAAIDLPGFKI